MYIIIIGAGEVGFNLAKQLSGEGHDVAIVECDPVIYQRVQENLDVSAIQGSGTSYKILEQAGIKDADLLVAVTTNDEVNLISAQIAKQYKVKKTIARVKNDEFLHKNAPLNADTMNIDLIIHPEYEAANAAIRLLHQTAATDVIDFENGRISVLGIQIEDDSPIVYQKLSQVSAEYQDFVFRIVAIQRLEVTRIPKGDDEIWPGDRIFVISKQEVVPQVISLAGKHDKKKNEHIMVMGGGRTGYLLARGLEKDHHVKLIEKDAAKSQELAQKLSKTLVIQGDGRDLNLLALEAITDMDAFIAATGDDETNIISSSIAHHLQVPRIIAMVDKTSYCTILPTIGVDAFVSRQRITVNAILKFIRKGNIVNVAAMPGISAEAIELIPKNGSKITQKPLAEISFPANAIVGAVMRGTDVFIPIGSTTLLAGDKVIIFTLPSAIKEVEKFFN
ncbi:MAG: Trk system potassium transporter TrkA [Deferribacteres bacterium]|nr:Trk system potassium transporter TrkA [candidate division KSB1 bacterium]MCB9503433.1 Trk system potassium transporter TrkA [Deferribacteres bacterium]